MWIHVGSIATHYFFYSLFSIFFLNFSPKCRREYNQSETPQKYVCFCGQKTDPVFHPWLLPHSCGETCGRPLKPSCGHTCLLLCHPGEWHNHSHSQKSAKQLRIMLLVDFIVWMKIKYSWLDSQTSNIKRSQCPSFLTQNFVFLLTGPINKNFILI